MLHMSHNSESIVEDSDSRVYTAIVPIYLTNTTMPTSPLVSLSQYTCVRKAVQLAIYAAISQKDVPLLVSMPAITAVPKTVTSTSLRRGLSAYDREAEFMVRVNITTVTDKSILESVLTTLYERIHIAPGTKDLVNNIGLSDVGRVRLNEFLRMDKRKSVENFKGGFHHMGTTRMGDDIKLSVVDKNCKVHDVDNLYIAGSSCFPTSSSVNPTLTLVALSARLSNFLKNKNT